MHLLAVNERMLMRETDIDITNSHVHSQSGDDLLSQRSAACDWEEPFSVLV